MCPPLGKYIFPLVVFNSQLLIRYVAWNAHETFQGKYNFEDNFDLVSYIKLAQQNDLLVILRPGPYIDAEWEYGGYPYWLANLVPKYIRTSNEIYLRIVDQWFSVLMPNIQPLLYKNGGPIISVQVFIRFFFIM